LFGQNLYLTVSLEKVAHFFGCRCILQKTAKENNRPICGENNSPNLVTLAIV
jgi:hypothetical protein